MTIEVFVIKSYDGRFNPITRNKESFNVGETSDKDSSTKVYWNKSPVIIWLFVGSSACGVDCSGHPPVVAKLVESLDVGTWGLVHEM